MFEAVISSSTPIDEIAQRTTEYVSVISERPYQPAQSAATGGLGKLPYPATAPGES
jgi:hypothetical protein